MNFLSVRYQKVINYSQFPSFIENLKSSILPSFFLFASQKIHLQLTPLKLVVSNRKIIQRKKIMKVNLSQKNKNHMNLNLAKTLQSKVKLTNNQILNLVSNQTKFNAKIQKYNRVGVESINAYRYDEALVYLHEAERILEYAAGCGKTIDRFLITTTLQNEACAYQRLWKVEKACDYMEALVQNHRASLGSCGGSEEDSNSNMVSNFISNRIDGVFYSLQYSAVNSQLGNHEESIAAVGEAIGMLKAVCDECGKYEKTIRGKNSPLMEELLKGFDINGCRLGTLLNQTRNALTNPPTQYKKQSSSHKLINSFTIGQVLQINTVTLTEARQRNTLEEQISTLGLIYKFLYLSICYFVLSTENRLSLNKKYPQHEIFKIEYKKSKIYHLWAIRIVAGVIGSESDYLNHIIKSFQKNYSIDVYSELNQCLEVSSIELESYSNSSNLLSINIPNLTGKEKDCEEDSKQDKLAKFFSNVKVISSSKPDSFQRYKKRQNDKSIERNFSKRPQQMKSKSQSKSKRKIVNKSMSNKSKDKFKSKEKEKKKSKSKSQSKSKSKIKSRKGSEKEYLQKICRKCGKGELSMSSNKSRGKIYEKKLNQILKFSNYTIPTSPSSAEINEEYFGSYSRNKSNKSPFVTQKRGKKSREKQCCLCSSKEKGKHTTNGIKFPSKRK